MHLANRGQRHFGKHMTLLLGENGAKPYLMKFLVFGETKQSDKARKLWLEALPYLKTHQRLLAWTRYNLGISALYDLEPEAERHFLEAVELTKNSKAAGMRASILCGLGASRRVLGEWDRAEYSYHQAINAASEQDNLEQAYIGLARTLRLAGRPTEALETLELALHIYDTETPIVNVGRALAFLALNDTKHAKAALERVGTLVAFPSMVVSYRKRRTGTA